MATPHRKLIADRINARFAGISVANGYKTDVSTVAREIFDWETANQEGSFPFICFRLGRTSYTYEAGRGVRGVMALDVVIHVPAATSVEKTDQISDFEDDVWAALADDQLNSVGATVLATSVKVQSFETDEGDPDTMDSHGGSGTGHIVAEIVYYRTADAT